jgi:hypothetical protein
LLFHHLNGHNELLHTEALESLYRLTQLDLLSNDETTCVADCFIRDAFHTGQRLGRMFPAKI